MLKVTAFALFAAFLGAQGAAAQTMTLTSPDIAPGAKIADEQVFNAFGCTGGNISPALVLVGRADGHEELCALGLRSRRADRQRLLALGRLQHPAGRDEPAQERGQSKSRRRA